VAGQFDGKVALVTGAGSGIGRASALAFAREGARVAVVDIDAANAAETVAKIEAAGGEAFAATVDVSQAGQVRAVIEQTVQTYGRLDCAHNNAGILGPRALTADFPEEDWDRIMSIDLKGIWHCLRFEIPQMLSQGGGAIVNTSSSAGLAGMRGFPAYTAAKHGVAGLTKTAALDYVRQGIRVNAVCPGFIKTPMIEGVPPDTEQPDPTVPAGRLGKPSEVAEAVLWLCSDAASYVTGHMLVVDGAMLVQ
jgi:NAD(P)-dependent dehydrogenase (short-subunit alcohol dehydrogenase family)